MTTKGTIALTELVEKGADVDLVREMIRHIAQRMMEMDAESLCAAAYGSAVTRRQSTGAALRSGELSTSPTEPRLTTRTPRAGTRSRRNSRAPDSIVIRWHRVCNPGYWRIRRESCSVMP